MSTETTTPMNTEKPTPDYGEPWTTRIIYGCHPWFDRHGQVVQMNDAEIERIRVCIQACAGMPDPAAEIEAMREEIERFKANNRYQRGYHHGEQSKAEEIQAMREAMQAAYEALDACNHADSCDSNVGFLGPSRPCDCGKDAALAKLQAFVKP